MPFQKGHKEFRSSESIERAKVHLRELGKLRKGTFVDTGHLKNFQYGEGHSPWNKGKKGYKLGYKSNRRNSGKWKKWRSLVFTRDNYICTKCGENNKNKLRVHHIKSFYVFPEVAFDIENGLTLCMSCHAKVHKFGGNK